MADNLKVKYVGGPRSRYGDRFTKWTPPSTTPSTPVRGASSDIGLYTVAFLVAMLALLGGGLYLYLIGW